MAKAAKKKDEVAEKPPKVSKPKNSLKITKVKVLGNILTLTIVETKNGIVSKPYSESFVTPVHPDLVAAVAGLAVHQGLINGHIKKVSHLDKVKPEMIEELRPTGYSINAKDTGLMITGMIKTENGQYTTYNTPMRLYEEDSASAYVHMEPLQEQIKLIDQECREFLAGRKIGEAPQIELDFEEQE